MTAPNQVTAENPYLSTLWQINSACKIRGNFHSSHTVLCNPSEDNQFAEGIAKESFAVHVMKAVTATVYGILGVIDETGDSKILFERNKESTQRMYEKLLTSNIPAYLESRDKTNMPFTEPSPGSTTWGNGNVGYVINQIQTTKTSDALLYQQVAVTGADADERLEVTQILEFYVKDQETQNIKSTKTACVKTITPSATSPAGLVEKENKTDGALIAVIVIVAILAIVLIVVVVVFFVLRK